MRSLISRDRASTSVWAIMPVNSKSEIDKMPRRFADVTRAAEMWGANGMRHRMGEDGWRCVGRIKPDATHAPLRRIAGANVGRCGRDKFVQPRRPSDHRVDKDDEISSHVVYSLREAYAALVAAAEGVL